MGFTLPMIGVLEGNVRLKKLDSFILMVGGIGYVIFPPVQLLAQVHQGDDLTLYTHTHVREDALSLFGFATTEELELFELLLTVSGIGPKTALSVVDRGVVHVRQAVVAADVDFFTTIPRLGRKNAQKVIIELKSKLGSLSELDLSGSITGETQELIEMLTVVGFSKAEAQSALKALPSHAVTIEDKIREALKLLGKRGI